MHLGAKDLCKVCFFVANVFDTRDHYGMIIIITFAVGLQLVAFIEHELNCL